MEFRKLISGTHDEGMGPLASMSESAFSGGYQGESIEHSLMDMRRGNSRTCHIEVASVLQLQHTRIPNLQRTEERKGNSHTCQCFTASTKQNSELQADRNAQVNEDDGALHLMIGHQHVTLGR